MIASSILGPLSFVFVPFVVSWLLTWLLLRWAPRLGLVDQPNERKVHTRPTPRGGGLAIFTGMVLAALLFAVLRTQYPVLGTPFLVHEAALFLGLSAIIVLLGLLDDLRPLPWQLRLLVQTAVAAAVVFSWSSGAGWPARLLALLWIVGLTNAFNMLDNMDALAGGTAWIAAAVFALAVLLRQGAGTDWGPAAPFLMLMGALAGFLWFNRPPARIFLGDAGSTFLGFFLGVRSLDGGIVEAGSWQTLAVPVCVLAVPWYDLISVVLLRLRQGRSPFHADKQHLSHRLVGLGLSPVWAVRVIHLLGLASGTAGLAFCEVFDHVGAVLVGVQFLYWWAVIAAIEYFSRQRAA